jgi:hypothetical protein
MDAEDENEDSSDEFTIKHHEHHHDHHSPLANRQEEEEEDVIETPSLDCTLLPPCRITITHSQVIASPITAII